MSRWTSTLKQHSGSRMLWGRDESRISGSREMILQWSMWLGSGIMKVCSIIQECIWLIISETQVLWFQQGSFLLHSKKPVGKLSIATHTYSSHELQNFFFRLFLSSCCIIPASPLVLMARRWMPFLVASAMRWKPKRKGTSLGSCLSYQENIFDSILVENTTGQKNDNITRLLWCSEPVAKAPQSLPLEGPAQVEFPALPLSHALPVSSLVIEPLFLTWIRELEKQRAHCLGS